MAIQLTDKLIIARGGTNYHVDATVLVQLMASTFGTNEFEAATYADVATITGMSIGDTAMCADASGDPTVTVGWAIYQYNGTAWIKISEQESLDVVVPDTDLSNTPTPTNITVHSSTGNDTILPLGTAVNSGLLAPADFTKLQFITVTGAVDLDELWLKRHVKAVPDGAATDNPINIDAVTQVVQFNIAQLTALP